MIYSVRTQQNIQSSAS